MNEIDLLRELRAGLPGPRPETESAARAALVWRVESLSAPARRRQWLPTSRGVRIAAIGFALAVIAAVVSVTGVAGRGETETALARVLNQVADVASEQQSQSPGPHQFLYTRSRSAYLSTVAFAPGCEERPCEASEEWSVLVPRRNESWVPFDGFRFGRVRSVTGKPEFVSEVQRAAWVAAGSPPLARAGQVEDSTLTGGVPLDGEDLPTDPAALRRLVEAREIPGVEGPPGEAETFVLIGDMLRHAYLPASVRAALYEATAELPGVELLGAVEDPAGRPGTGIAYADRKRGVRHELILDPETSALLGERDSLIRSGAHGFEGTTIGYAAYLEEKVVDSVGAGAPRGAAATMPVVRCYDRASLSAGVTVTRGNEPILTCQMKWPGEAPNLVPCGREGSKVTSVFPGSSPAVCRRLGLQLRP